MWDRVNRQYHNEEKAETSPIGMFGLPGLAAYVVGVMQGYIQGFTGEHRTGKRIGSLLLPAAAFVMVCFFIHLASPVLPQLKKEAGIAQIEASVAQAAEEEQEINQAGEAETALKEDEPEEKEPAVAVEKEAEGREDIVPLDNSILEPSDTYAEKGSVAVFQAYHPDAAAYRWETETEAGEWEIVSPDAVMEKTDELRRNISLLEVAADKEKTIRCQMSVEDGPALNYTAELHILSAPIASISSDGFSAETGSYVKAGEIPLKVTYTDGKQDVITGLSGLHFLDTEESRENSETAAGNLKEIITTVKTACDYSHLEAGMTEKILCYRNPDGEFIEVPVNMEGLDLTSPVINELSISEFEVSKTDQPVPVTVSFSASDDVTPVCQLTYAFLPAGEEPQEEDWREEPVFVADIAKNGLWTAYCRDAAGNMATTDRKLIVVDSKAPVIRLSLQKEEWCQKNTIYVSAEDSLPVKYRYICTTSGEDSGWVTESSKAVSANGTWTIQVQDGAGNIAEQEIMVDNIDNQAPVIRSITEKKEGEAVKNEE